MGERASGREGERARNAWEPVKGWPLGVSVEGPYDDARFTDAAARCPLLEAVVQALRDACRHASEITSVTLRPAAGLMGCYRKYSESNST